MSALAACGEDPDVATVHVSPSGIDAEDGVAAPVKTLGRAFELAFGDGRIKRIVLEAGRYGVSNGEAYPYIVPANLTIEGPADGGAVLAGEGLSAGLRIETGELHNLALEDFSTALTATEIVRLANVRIGASEVAVRVAPSARLASEGLEITGRPGACSAGIEVEELAQFGADGLVTRTLGAHLDAGARTVVNVDNVEVLGDPACPQALFRVAGSDLNVEDAIFTGGRIAILFAAPPESATHATLTRTTIQNATEAGIAGPVSRVFESGPPGFLMVGGALLGNGRGVDATGGWWALDGVVITGNGAAVRAIDVQTMSITDSTVTGNGTGIRLERSSGGIWRSTIRNDGVGVEVVSPDRVSAPENTWHANVQGADAAGKYTAGTIGGPITGANYSLVSGAILDLRSFSLPGLR